MPKKCLTFTIVTVMVVVVAVVVMASMPKTTNSCCRFLVHGRSGADAFNHLQINVRVGVRSTGRRK